MLGLLKKSAFCKPDGGLRVVPEIRMRTISTSNRLSPTSNQVSSVLMPVGLGEMFLAYTINHALIAALALNFRCVMSHVGYVPPAVILSVEQCAYSEERTQACLFLSILRSAKRWRKTN